MEKNSRVKLCSVLGSAGMGNFPGRGNSRVKVAHAWAVRRKEDTYTG